MFFGRQLIPGQNNPEVLNGYRIPAGSAIVVSPWTVHRSPKIWDNPEAFDPRRFDIPAGQFPGGHKYAWFPFGAGPHACIGMQLAMLETPIVLATILQNYSLSQHPSSRFRFRRPSACTLPRLCPCNCTCRPRAPTDALTGLCRTNDSTAA
jgi:cytochrome P450